MRHAQWWAATCWALLGGGTTLAIACGGSSGPSGFTGSGGSGGSGGDASSSGESGMGTGSDAGLHLHMDGNTSPDTSPVDTGPPPTVAVVYPHSPSTLYTLNPKTDAISIVAPFNGDCSSSADCDDVIDLALDKDSNAYITSFNAFYKLDLTTAATTLIATGSYPNSLSFVPAGTLDPTAEALVGYFGSTYVRIDTTTGKVTDVGALSGGYSSSGDIVSVIGGGTYLTVVGNDCGDCLLQVDPTTGDIIQNYGSVNHAEVYGIAYWAGTVYGFDNAGVMFSITFPAGKLVTTDIPFPSAPSGLEFWGAGSTTSAPPKSADGGMPPPPPK
jgi:hypothetical protein